MNRGKAQRRLLPRLLALTITVTAVIAAIVAHTACGRAGSATPGHALAHDAYIWQRQWTPSLDRAVLASASRVRAWRVLAAEVDRRGLIVESSPHLDVLARAARPVIPVIRISGRLSDWDADDAARDAAGDPAGAPARYAAHDLTRELVARSQTLVRRWRDAGVDVTGVETDYDCPTGSLPRYASFLATLREAHPRDVALSITALPTWLDSARLRDVLQHVDEAVLQVHAVQHPEAGLFDGHQARAWAREWSDVSRKVQKAGKAGTASEAGHAGSIGGVPFRIALPTYGSRVTWTGDGRITGIESEARTFGDPASGRELFVTPLEAAAFIETLRGDQPSNLTGLVWFRVPTAEDERAWSLDTWHAVMDGRALPRDAGINASVEPSATIPGLYDVYLRNRGIVDALVPERVTLTSQSTCEAADALAPYAMEKRHTAIEFRRVSPRMLARDRRALIGWVRCPIGEIEVDAGS